MHLKELSIVNFKNCEQAEFQFSTKINCIVGNNGVGKTNLLDAIFYLSFCKSYFNSIDSQNIKHDADFFVVQGKYIRDEQEENVYCGMKRSQKKQFKRNKKEYQRLSEHIGLLPLVMISPSDISLIVEGSEERRKYMNFVISQFDKEYLDDVISYNKALKQRNVLLKQFAKNNRFDDVVLDIWNDQLVTYGNRIYEKRVAFINKLIPVFQKYYDYVSGSTEVISLEYNSQLHNSDFKELLKASVSKDLALQYTTVGVHKDDLLLRLDGFPIKRVGSQGQKKTYLVALKLAQFDFIKELNGFEPVMLLDDIFDKLDTKRVEQIVKLVADNHFGQIFITDTNREHLDNILKSIEIDYNVFNIDNGEVKIS